MMMIQSLYAVAENKVHLLFQTCGVKMWSDFSLKTKGNTNTESTTFHSHTPLEQIISFSCGYMRLCSISSHWMALLITHLQNYCKHSKHMLHKQCVFKKLPCAHTQDIEEAFPPAAILRIGSEA